MAFRVLDLFRRKKTEDEHARHRNLASEYIDGELAAETADNIKEHLGLCPPCQSFFETLKATVGLLRSSEKRNAPASFKERVLERLKGAE